MIEHRYEEEGGRWWLASYGVVKKGLDRMGGWTFEEAPQWLQDIVLLAKVGSHLTVHLPEDRKLVVWFTTDEEHRLKEFIELGSQKELPLED